MEENLLLGKYEGLQTPIERLRNKLTPYLTLVEILGRNASFLNYGDSHENKILLRLLNTCSQFNPEIHDYLADCDEFYSGSLWEFCYSDCIHESSLMTMSLHRTKRGAEMAMEFHKEQERKEFMETYQGKEVSTFGIKFGHSQAWVVNEIKVND